MNNREIHYRYALSYLIILLIMSVGFGLFNVPNLVDKVSFSLTVTSLVLGVVAIIYTFISANKQDAQLSKLIDTNANMSSAANEIRYAATAITEQVGTIPPRLDLLDEKLSNIPRSSQTSHSGLAGTANNSIATDIAMPEYTLDQLKKFIVSLPFSGMACLYLFQRAREHTININEKLVARITTIPYLYFIGLLTYADASGLISYTVSEGTITPVSSITVFSDNIVRLVRGVLDYMDEHQKPMLKNMLDAIDRELPAKTNH
jgi:uncharacterized membrane protein